MAINEQLACNQKSKWKIWLIIKLSVMLIF